jgi:hypothetical protein
MLSQPGQLTVVLLPGRKVPGRYGGGHASILPQSLFAVRSMVYAGFWLLLLSKHSKWVPEKMKGGSYFDWGPTIQIKKLACFVHRMNKNSDSC